MDFEKPFVVRVHDVKPIDMQKETGSRKKLGVDSYHLVGDPVVPTKPGHELLFGLIAMHPGKIVPLHQHSSPCEEVYFVLNGRGKLILGEKEFDLEPETVVYIPPKIPHKVVNVGTTPLRIIVTMVHWPGHWKVK